MTWDTDRSQRLPDNWETIRQHVKARAHGRCQARLHNGTQCTAKGTDCDHIQHGDNHNLDNLQWLCRWHHKQKTRQEAQQELAIMQRKNKPRKPQHPGLTDPTGGDPLPGAPSPL